MIRSFRLAVVTALFSIADSANIFVSHYDGFVTALTLTSISGGAYSLSTNSTLTIGGQPSWITFDSSSRTLYVADETGYGTSASLTAVSAATNGGLSLLGKANAPLGAVANVLYGSGNGFIANAH